MWTYFTILVSLMAFDGLWLGVITRSFYKTQMAHLSGVFLDKFLVWPAAIFYVMYAFGIMYFVVGPALEAKSLTLALTRGAFLGLIAYATYDLTNQATIAKWPVIITVADVAWGVVATALVSAIVYTIISKMS